MNSESVRNYCGPQPDRDIEYAKLLAEIWRLPPNRIMQIAGELARVREDCALIAEKHSPEIAKLMREQA